MNKPTKKKKAVVSLGHEALGYTTLEQWDAVKTTAKALADLVEADYQLTITHSNGRQVSMIHKAMTELRRIYIDYTPAPMCVCSAMSQGYVGYDIQNALRAELLDRGIAKTISTILTQVTVDPYDEAFYTPTKVIGRYMSAEDAEVEKKKGNFVKEEPGKGFRRVVAAPSPINIVEIDAIRTLADADQIVIACGGGGIPVIEQNHILKGASAVIEKDAVAGRLAVELQADELRGGHHVTQNRSRHRLFEKQSEGPCADHLPRGCEGGSEGKKRHYYYRLISFSPRTMSIAPMIMQKSEILKTMRRIRLFFTGKLT